MSNSRGAQRVVAAQLARAGKNLARLPGGAFLAEIAARALAVAEPAGQFHMLHPAAMQDPPEGPAVHIVSANLWHDWPRMQRIQARLEAFARLCEQQQAAIVLLQEVARVRTLWIDAWLAHRLGMAAIYARANGHLAGIGFEEGLAVLSHFPLSTPRVRRLGSHTNPFVRRLALGACVTTPHGPLWVFSAHLALLPRENARQLADLRRWVSHVAGGEPALIGGDFNAPEHRMAIDHARRDWLDAFRHRHPGADASTHTLRWPWGAILRRHRLDYVFLHASTGRWVITNVQHIATPGIAHSDHDAVSVQLSPHAP